MSLNKLKMPKKPNIYGDGYDEDGNLIYDTYDCPNCQTSYELEYEKHDYCPHCGQALDWNDKFCDNAFENAKKSEECNTHTFFITEKEVMLVQAYREHEQLQNVIDKILDLPNETRNKD